MQERGEEAHEDDEPTADCDHASIDASWESMLRRSYAPSDWYLRDERKETPNSSYGERSNASYSTETI